MLTTVNFVVCVIIEFKTEILIPQLGVVSHNSKEFVIADIPGLIEGAHDGRGLGDRFLAHIERCKILIHMVDASQEDPLNAYRILRDELRLYSEELSNKPEIIVLNKIDLLEQDDLNKLTKKFEKECGKVVKISAIQRNNIDEVLGNVVDYLNELEKLEQEQQIDDTEENDIADDEA